MEHALGPAWAQAVEASAFAAAIRSSSFLYPAANVAHIFGIALVLGAITAFDLRLLGFVRAIPVPAASALLTPLTWIGFALILPSGIAMFAADAGPLATSALFQAKMALLALGLANAGLFRALWQTRLAGWDAAPPPLGRLQVVLSLALWPTVIVLGRLLGYY